jgi:hypothetical protein
MASTRIFFYSCQLRLWGGKPILPPIYPPKSSVFQAQHSAAAYQYCKYAYLQFTIWLSPCRPRGGWCPAARPFAARPERSTIFDRARVRDMPRDPHKIIHNMATANLNGAIVTCDSSMRFLEECSKKSFFNHVP